MADPVGADVVPPVVQAEVPATTAAAEVEAVKTTTVAVATAPAATVPSSTAAPAPVSSGEALSAGAISIPEGTAVAAVDAAPSASTPSDVGTSLPDAVMGEGLPAKTSGVAATPAAADASVKPPGKGEHAHNSHLTKKNAMKAIKLAYRYRKREQKSVRRRIYFAGKIGI